jgi:protein-S-isoprenylcysteine O-methyltransferase Ste14
MNPHGRLTEQFERQGQWLYHRRSVAIIAILPLLVLAIGFPGFPGRGWLHGTAVDHLGEACLLISFAGLALRWFTVGFVPANTSVRSTREQRAAVLNTTGMYSVVRHPLYLANSIVAMAFAAATGSLWFLLVLVAANALYIERIAAAEERFLAAAHGQAWSRWAAKTPAFIPDFSLWQPADLRFSLRTVLRREYNGVLHVALAYFLLEAVYDLDAGHQTLSRWLVHDPLWVGLLLAGLAVHLSLRTLKRHTRQLHVGGR